MLKEYDSHLFLLFTQCFKFWEAMFVSQIVEDLETSELINSRSIYISFFEWFKARNNFSFSF